MTTGNLFCGFYSIISTHHSHFMIAAWAILAASVFDLLDGRLARLANATSLFGLEYDSLSDLVSFGVAPSLLLYQSVLISLGHLGFFSAFLFIMCGAIRLARFNLTSSVSQKNSNFQGLPIPVAASMLASCVLVNFFIKSGYHVWLMLGLTLILAILMVSSFPFLSLKTWDLKDCSPSSYLFMSLGLIGSCILMLHHPELTLFSLHCLYITASVGWILTQNLIKLAHTSK